MFFLGGGGGGGVWLESGKICKTTHVCFILLTLAKSLVTRQMLMHEKKCEILIFINSPVPMYQKLRIIYCYIKPSSYTQNNKEGKLLVDYYCS